MRQQAQRHFLESQLGIEGQLAESERARRAEARARAASLAIEPTGVTSFKIKALLSGA